MMSSEGDELNWLATQYVLGELPDTECDAFEQRLITDLAACEAVASATKLLATVHCADSSPHPVTPATSLPSTTRTKPHWPVISSTVVALSLVGTAFWFSSPATPPAGSEVTMLNADEDLGDADLDEPDDEAPLTIPEWLIAGVSLEEPETKDN